MPACVCASPTIAYIRVYIYMHIYNPIPNNIKKIDINVAGQSTVTFPHIVDVFFFLNVCGKVEDNHVKKIAKFSVK